MRGSGDAPLDLTLKCEGADDAVWELPGGSKVSLGSTLGHQTGFPGRNGPFSQLILTVF